MSDNGPVGQRQEIAAAMQRAATASFIEARLKILCPEEYQDRRISRWRLAEAQGWRCAYCGCHMDPAAHGVWNPLAVTRDHIIPVVEGGTRTFANLVAACALCNTYRRSMKAETFWLIATGRWPSRRRIGRGSLSGVRSYLRARERRGDPVFVYGTDEPLWTIERPASSPIGDRELGTASNTDTVFRQNASSDTALPAPQEGGTDG